MGFLILSDICKHYINDVLVCKKNNLKCNKIYTSAIPEHSFTISTLIPSLKKIGKGMPKIESENQFLTSIKGRNFVLICKNLPICNPRTLLSNINSHSKFEENWLKKMLLSESENDALTDRRTFRQTDRQTDGHSNAIF